MSKLPHPFPELAENYYITSSWDELNNIIKYYLLDKDSFFYYIIISVLVLRIFFNAKLQGTHTLPSFGDMGKTEHAWARERGTAWYRSKEPIPIDHPFVGDGYLGNKKWPLIEGNTFSYTTKTIG